MSLLTRLPPGSPQAAFLATRAALLLVAYLGLKLVPLELEPGQWRAFPDALLLDGWARWDSGWYWTIVARGYYFHLDAPSNVNFFPLYPLLAGLLSLPLRLLLAPDRAFYLAGFLLSHAACLLALSGLHRLTRETFDDASASRAVWLCALFPFSLFLSAVYTEALFFALAVWAFALARRERWPAACALAGLCAVTRIVGLLALLGLGLEYLRQRGWRPWPLRREALSFLLAPLGLVALLVYYARSFGDPLVFQYTQVRIWNRKPGLQHIVGGVRSVVSGALPLWQRALTSWYLVLIPVGIALSIRAWRRLGSGYALFCLIGIGLAAYTQLPGFGRYVSVLFPLFMVSGELLRRRSLFAAACALFVPFLVLFTVQFARWQPVT